MPKRAPSVAPKQPPAKRTKVAADSPAGLCLEEYRRRLKKQGKYEDTKPGTRSLDGCLHDPPRLPPIVKIVAGAKPIPKRGTDGCLHFVDHPEFKPNLTPAQVMQLGSFGGTYFRDITSAVTGNAYVGRKVIAEFPKSWFQGVDLDAKVLSPLYHKNVNKYGVSCGGGLGQWETSGWISSLDPYGWFQWYCRFYLGRRSTDDVRQIARWAAGQGPNGRWRIRLCNDLIRAGAKLDNERIGTVVRQVLQHWAYQLTGSDLAAHWGRG